MLFLINLGLKNKAFKQKKKNELLICKSVELGCDLYESYNQGIDHVKHGCLKNVGVELFLNTKKELSLADNSFLNLINFCNFQNGGA